MRSTSSTLALLRAAHRAGAWVFDHSGPFAPVLARLGYVVHDRLFPHAFFVNLLNPIPLEGLRIHHEGRPSYHVQMLAMGMHDREVVRLLKEFVGADMRVLDVGAHLGYFSLLSARLAGPGGTVWAFEPSSNMVVLLRENIRENGFDRQIHVVPQAVSNTSGHAILHVDPAESMLSRLCGDADTRLDFTAHLGATPRAPHPGAVTRMAVECTTLDAWAAQQNWPAVDLIKLDIEGFEKSALEGMVELGRRNPTMKLIVELNPKALSRAGATIEEFWGALQNCGFRKISMAGRALQRVEFPADAPKILREIRRLGNDRVNLLCEMDATQPSYPAHV